MIANDELRDTLARRDQIKRSCRSLCDAFARKLSEDALDTWAERLEPYATSPHLWRVLKDAVTWEQWPNLGVVLSKVQSEIKHNEGTKTPPPLTERERQRSDNSAIVAMLWLVYEHGWKPEDFGGHVLARAFLRLPIDPPKNETEEQRLEIRSKITGALRTAMMQYDRATVARLMEQQ